MLSTRQSTHLFLPLCLIAALGCIKTQPGNTPATNSGGTSPAEHGTASSAGTGEKLQGVISIEGSSTVFPISQAMSREFEARHPEVKIPVANNGTTAGFKKFIAREVEICDASRPITENETKLCQDNGIEFVELQLAIDGLTVVVHKDNDWVDAISVADLKQIWDQESTIQKWNEVNPNWPDAKLELFGAGTDSGTFDYFTEAINGKARRSRSDYSPSENDNILVSGVSGNKYAMGYFGYAYYVNAADKLKALKIIPEGQTEGVAPSPETVESGAYTPLSRPLFIYVNQDALKRPEVKEFVTYCLSDEGQDIVAKRKYIRINAEKLAEARQRLAEAAAAK